jgi:hypothetical protein
MPPIIKKTSPVSIGTQALGFQQGGVPDGPLGPVGGVPEGGAPAEGWEYKTVGNIKRIRNKDIF